MKVNLLPLILCFLLAPGHTSSINELRRITECICLNYSIVYECLIDGDGFTLWRGSAFDCIESSNEINLAHNMFMQGDEGSCNNGNIVARSIPTNSTAYVSQLTILNFNLVLNGKRINCSHGNGITSNIGTEVVMISDSFPPPDDVHLALIRQEQLTFNWSTSAFNCHGLSYHVHSNCGMCNKTSLTSATCHIQNSNVECSFAVGTIICNNIVGNLSDPLNVIIRVLKVPIIVSVNLTFSGVRGYLTAVNITFTQLDIFNVTDRIDGSAIYHLARYEYSASTPQCLPISDKIPASACMDELCSAFFSHPASCLSNATVSVASVNTVGEGLAENITIGSSKNDYLEVTYDQETTTIRCNFLRELRSISIKTCHVEYGPCGQQPSVHSKENYTTNASPNTAIIQLPSDILGYCFTATARNNSTFSVQLIDGVIVGTDCRLNSTDSNLCSNQRVIIVGVVLGVFSIICVLVFFVVGVVCYKIGQKQQPYAISRRSRPESENLHDRNSEDEVNKFVSNCNREKKYEPVARFDHFMAGHDNCCYMFGGQVHRDAENENCLSKTVKVYDKRKEKWTAQRATGKQPDALYEGACCTSTSGDIYYFGGRYESEFSGALFKLSTSDIKWTQLKGEPQLNNNIAPMKKIASGIACLRGQKEYLITFGGYGKPHAQKQDNSSNIKLVDRVWTNEVHVFNLEKGEWVSRSFSGTRPTPRSHFSFTGIDRSRALLFGGARGATTSDPLNDLYTFVINDGNVEHITEKKDNPKPPGRLCHAACCLSYGSSDNKLGLFVHGGIGEHLTTLDDAWIFYVTPSKWRKLELSGMVEKRCGHSATAIQISETRVHVVMFGGSPKFQSEWEDKLQRMAETRVLELEYETDEEEWRVRVA